MVSSAPLVPGPLYGSAHLEGGDARGGRERLSAPQRGTPWGLGRDWEQATCGEEHAGPRRELQAAASTPGTRAAQSARRVLRSRFDLPGIVEADGAVEVHEEGFPRRARAAVRVRAAPRAQPVPDRSPGRRLRRRRSSTCAGPEELLAVCRERRLGLQPPVVEELLGAAAIAERRRARARQRRDDALRVVAALLVLALVGVLALARSCRGRSGGEVGRGGAGVVGAALRLLPLLLAAERGEVEEVVGAAGHSRRRGRTCEYVWKTLVADAQEAAQARHLIGRRRSTYTAPRRLVLAVRSR